MGGEVLELMSDRIAAAEEAAAHAYEQGIEREKAEVAERLRAAGYPEEAVRIALGSTSESIAE